MIFKRFLTYFTARYITAHCSYVIFHTKSEPATSLIPPTVQGWSSAWRGSIEGGHRSRDRDTCEQHTVSLKTNDNVILYSDPHREGVFLHHFSARVIREHRLVVCKIIVRGQVRTEGFSGPHSPSSPAQHIYFSL